MAEYYNLDAIPNTIFDQIIIDPLMNMDEIFQSNFVDHQELQHVKIKEQTFEIDMASVVNETGQLQHDCMWSGTCQDPSHPNKQKNKNFSVEAVCKNFEKELGWASTSGSEADDDYEEYMAQSVVSSYPATARALQSTIPQQLLLNALAQAIPRFPPHRQLSYQVVNEHIREYVLPPGTSIQGPSRSTQVKIPQNQIFKVEPKPEKEPLENVVKFVPSCGIPCPTNSTVQQFMLPPQLKIEPIYVYSTEQISSMPVDFNYGNLNATMNTANTAQLSKNPKKRKMPKPVKKTTKKGASKFLNPFALEADPLTIQKFGTCTEVDTQPIFEKRNLHNDLERQRRIGLRNLFVELKNAIPTISESDRVPKVNILREAISYCSKVQRDEYVLTELQKQNYRLKSQAMKLGINPDSNSSTSSASSYNEDD